MVRAHRRRAAPKPPSTVVSAWTVALGAAVSLALSSCSGQSVEAGPFAGTWHVHTFSLTVQHGQTGAFEWPTHVACGTGPGQGPPPCDHLVPGTVVGPNGQVVHVENIIDGGHATLTLTNRSGTTARGIVSHSTQRSVVPDGKVTVTLGANDVIYFRFASPPTVRAYDYLCGRATNQSLINCGA